MVHDPFGKAAAFLGFHETCRALERERELVVDRGGQGPVDNGVGQKVQPIPGINYLGWHRRHRALRDPIDNEPQVALLDESVTDGAFPFDPIVVSSQTDLDAQNGVGASRILHDAQSVVRC